MLRGSESLELRNAPNVPMCQKSFVPKRFSMPYVSMKSHHLTQASVLGKSPFMLCPALWVNMKIPRNVDEMDPRQRHRKGLMLIALVNYSCMMSSDDDGDQGEGVVVRPMQIYDDSGHNLDFIINGSP
jgi:hypothetical protein